LEARIPERPGPSFGLNTPPDKEPVVIVRRVDGQELVARAGKAIGYPTGRNGTFRKLIAHELQFQGAAADPIEPHDGEPSRPGPSPAAGRRDELHCRPSA